MHETLTQLGLTEKEASVYLVLLRNGPALASTLAIRTKLKRVTVYGVLDSLIVRGLVSFESTQEGRRYLPHDPECLLYFLEQEKAALQMKWDLTKNCIQALNQSTTQVLDARQVLFFKGLEGLKEAFKDFLDPEQNLYGILGLKSSTREKDLLALISKRYRKLKLISHTKTLNESEHKNTLLVQGPKVFFLCERREIELMLIRNKDYAETVFRFLLEPHLKSQESSPEFQRALF